MKYRESGMPSEQLWATFFQPELILEQMGIDRQINTLIDIGCGYGTFLLPAARLVGSRAIGIDIDNDLIEFCREKARITGLINIDLIQGDICSENIYEFIQTYQGKVDYITLFNILHCEEPLPLLKKAYMLLRNHGKLGVIHWKCEPTPRGPSMVIRPTPNIITNWCVQSGFQLKEQINLPPYHYGLVFQKIS